MYSLIQHIISGGGYTGTPSLQELKEEDNESEYEESVLEEEEEEEETTSDDSGMSKIPVLKLVEASVSFFINDKNGS